MKKIILLCAMCIPMLATSTTFAVGRGDYGTQPSEVLDSVVGEANKTVKIQDTAMDRVTDAQ